MPKKSNKTGRRQQRGKRLQASTGETQETPVRAKRGLKRPPNEELEKIMRLVNLLPPAGSPPLRDDDNFVETFNSLQPELREYLSSQAEGEAYDDWSIRAESVIEWAYQELVEAREALLQLIRQSTEKDDEETIYFHGHVDAGAYLNINGEGVIEVKRSRFAHAVTGAEVNYIRRCEMCGNIFYAGRERQPCCTPKCAAKLRRKRWRERHPDYRPPGQTSPASQVENVQRCLKLWKPKFIRTRRNEQELAAQADITLKQCQAALDSIGIAKKETRSDGHLQTQRRQR